MTDTPKKNRGLGRGLSALMADVGQPGPAEDASQERRPDMVVPIESIYPNPEQPRRRFTTDQLEDLASSIRAKGVIQPLIVRPGIKSGSYEIVAGERRWRAAQMAQLHELPVIVREFDDTEVLEVAIIENVQRENLNPIEEATGYRQLLDRFGRTQDQLAEALGKSRSHIANLMRLLALPDDVVEMVRDGTLSAGHARALITSENASELAKTVVSGGLSVRATEKLVKSPPKSAGTSKRTRPEKDADTRALEADLSAALKMKVSVDFLSDNDGGKLTITYRDLDQLDDLCRLLGGMN